MILRLAAKRRWLAAAAVLVLATFGAAGLARAVTTPTNCAGCFAMVRSDATLVYYRGVKANYKPKPGEYYIDFLYPISKMRLNTRQSIFGSWEGGRVGLYIVTLSSGFKSCWLF